MHVRIACVELIADPYFSVSIGCLLHAIYFQAGQGVRLEEVLCSIISPRAVLMVGLVGGGIITVIGH